MRWKGRRQSDNVEDRRGVRAGTVAGGGGVLVIAFAIVVMLMGGDPSALLGQVDDGRPGAAAGPRGTNAREDELKELVSVTLADTEDVWNREFERRGGRYQEPKLVVFSDQVRTGCGLADSGVGPFYCGADRTVYIDLSFYDTLRDRFGAAGDFAQSYVIAHEVGHHVQELLGTMDKVDQQRSRLNETRANALSVRLELQADYYAGVWANQAKDAASLDRKDIEEAIEAASAIGDDAIQKQAQGYVEPDRFTHGTSDQRVKWFLKGFESGKLEDGDTFSPRNP